MSLLRIAAGIIPIFMVAVQVTSLEIQPPGTCDAIDNILNRTFDHIILLAHQANSSLFAFVDNQTAIATTWIQATSVSDDISKLLDKANGFDQDFYAQIDRTIDDAILATDKSLNEAAHKIEILMRDSEAFPLVDRSLTTVQDISWLFQDWVRRYVSFKKPDLVALVHGSFIAADKAHEEALRNPDSPEPAQEFLKAFQSGSNNDIWLRACEVVFTEFGRAIEMQRNWAQYVKHVCKLSEEKC